MLSTSAMGGKPYTRRSVLSRRDALTAEMRAAASAVIADETAMLLGELEAGAVVALYAPKGSEVDTSSIDASVRARGFRVVYPRVVDGDRRLALHEVMRDELVIGRFGLREPPGDAPAIELQAVRAFVVPGLAFDRTGGRIGWGRGYYDATLAAAPSALRIGLAFECQLVELIERDPHDAQLHYVVTEAAIYQSVGE